MAKKRLVGDALRYAEERRHDIERIREDHEPLLRARAMAEAVAGVLYDLYMDDPGDDDRRFMKELRRAQIRAEKLVNSFGRLMEPPK